jgi:FMN phosphatase YigB (HAD superfamily)
MSVIEAVFFDLGETLVNEGEIYGRWADWLRVPRHTFNAVLGGAIARGDSYPAVFEHFRPGFDLAAEERARAEAGVPNLWGADDLYPDARGCLAALKAQGLHVGVAGNQPKEVTELVAGLGLAADVIGISDNWGVQKPDLAFFARVTEEASRGLGRPIGPDRILYVGDRVDNDVRPALAFGMPIAFLRRGPWGHVQSHDAADVLPRCLFRLDDLDELPALVAAHNAPYALR